MIESLAQWIKTEGIPAVLGLVVFCVANSTAQLVMANAASSVTVPVGQAPSRATPSRPVGDPHISQGEK